MVDLQPDGLVQSAIELAGSDDLGPDDFREGLEVLCESVLAEAQLNDLGRFAMQQNILGGLVNRIRVQDWARRHPDLLDQPVGAPLVVIGMFRAGTTLLSQLLDRDAANRALLRWEAADSVPPPTPQTYRHGPRVDTATSAIEILEGLNPKIPVVHHEEAAGPTECITVLGQDFKSMAWEAMANLPTYGQWLLGADYRSAYEYHRTVLQVLQSGGRGGVWTLKSPNHALALEALTTVYPDARLVLLHRDPAVLCASACSLIATLTGTFSDADHGAYIAAHWTEVLARSVHRIDAFRRAHPERQVIDVHYADLLGDPMGCVRAIYAACDREPDGAASESIDAYLAAHPKGRFGVHQYGFDDYGLNAPALYERFADYIDRYGVVRELGAV